MGVLNQLHRVADVNNLSQVEKVKRVLVIDKPFTVQSGLITNSQKLKRF